MTRQMKQAMLPYSADELSAAWSVLKSGHRNLPRLTRPHATGFASSANIGSSHSAAPLGSCLSALQPGSTVDG